MRLTKVKSQPGFTLVEAALAIVVIAVAALGALSYEYFAAIHSRIAKAEMTATQTGQFLLEDWKSTGGAEDYNPANFGVGFVSTSDNTYRITKDELPMQVSLSYADISEGSEVLNLRQITARIRWRRDYAQGEIRQTDPELVFTTYAKTGE